MAEPGTDPAGGQAAPPPPPPPPPPPQTETADTAGGHAATPPQPPSSLSSISSIPSTDNQPPAMTEPGTDPAGGQAVPPTPPPPPPQTETADTAGGHAATPPQPPQTETVGPGPVPTPPQNQTAVQTAGQPQVQPQPRPQTGMGEVAGQPRTPRAPSQVRASAADAEKQPPAPSPPPPPPQQQQQKDKGERSKRRRDEAEESAASGRKEKAAHQTERPPEGGIAGDAVDKPTDGLLLKKFQKIGMFVKWLMSWYRRHRSPEEPAAASAEESKSKEGKVEENTKQPSIPAQGDKPPEEKQETPVDKPTDGVLLKKLQKIGGFVKWLMSWYRPHRSPAEGKVQEITKQPPMPAQGDKPPVDKAGESKSKEGKVEEITKQPSMPAQEHKNWPREEARLEKILEEAFDGLLAADFRELGNKERKCLLTFSVFALASEVKKQAVTYWWATRFELSPEKGKEDVFTKLSADVFRKLSGDGFLEPIKNRCSGVIHGCRVNPLVHWMVKRQARPKYAADLGDRVELGKRGDPRKKQPNSEVLCLTAGNRVRLQRPAKDESKARRKDEPKARRKPGPKEAPTPQGQGQGQPHDPQPAQPQPQPQPQGSQNGKTRPEDERERRERELRDAAELRNELKNKTVILNVSAHVYRLPGLSDLANNLVVLQLGRWWNSDNDTYMEVEGLAESLRSIGSLKKLRYLSLRGLSRLTELPSEIRQLTQLAILDVRGCQNLVKVASQAIKSLKGLTHLDLTECYMLEHISQGVTSLPELRVFKGFVFGVGTARRSKACRLQDLVKLKKLEKLSVNVTTDAHVRKGEMKQLKQLTSLRSLTVTWGELPSILVVDSQLPDGKKEGRLKELLDKWTGLELPLTLEKLDVRCYPEKELPKEWFVGREKLKKLYVRGGEIKKLEIPETNCIEILRLRYLKHFKMPWADLLSKFEKLKSVEVVIKDPKVMKIETRDKKDPQKVPEDPQKKKEAKEEELRLMANMKKQMSIPGSTLDENGVWMRDAKEDENKKGLGDGKKGEGSQGVADKSNEPSEAAQAPSGKVPEEEAHKTEAAPSVAEVPKASEEAGKGDDGGGDAGKAQTAPPSSNDQNKEGEEGGQGGSLGGAEEADEPPTKGDGGDAPEVPGEVKKVDGGDAGKAQTEGEEGQGGRPTPRVSEKADEEPTGEDGGDAPEVPGEVKKVDGGDAEGEEGQGGRPTPRMSEKADEEPTGEDGGDAPEVPGEVKKVDGGDAGKAQTEGEEGQGGHPTPRVSEKADEEPTGEDGVDDDTSPADATRSPAASQPLELPRRPDVPDKSSPSVSDLKEDASAKLVQANASASGTTPPPVPPATSTTAKPKEPGKADDDGGSN